MKIPKPAFRIIAIVAFSLIYNDLWPQFGAGVSLGASQNKTTSNAAPFNSRQKALTGLFLDLQATYDLRSWLSLQADIEYIQKNTRLDRTGFYQDNYTSNYFNFLQLPVTARFTLGTGKFQGFLNLGGFMGYCLNGRLKGVTSNIIDYAEPTIPNPKISELFGAIHFDENYRFEESRDNRFEAGYVVGGGLQYSASRSCRVFVQTRHYHDITNQYKEAELFPVRSYNQSFQISIGTSFNLSKN
ncbi:outer membrane beta-barrel protein [Niabella beijingensis]|uniref:outer membrane beta-barrel protein n=1 Tax=Niabella beijingensis TaxID=2872700 RepID=UPI001CC00E7F|nr:outer membrane beta-barrel protein [Niabella beijingensis]MBZ4191927.1 PorT family protein [Niabella beijingensis]